MFTKSRNKKGFTLMEMLIVVAIISVLVSVSFPVFNNQLETARVATDDANMRSAKAVAMVEYLTTGTPTSAYYDADKGIFVGNTTEAANIKRYGQSGTNKGKMILVNFDPDMGKAFTATWEKKLWKNLRAKLTTTKQNIKTIKS